MAPAQWITGYYSDQMGMPVSSIPWNMYTHVIMFAAAPCLQGDGKVCHHYLLQRNIEQFVTAGHAAGKKVLVTIKDNEHNPSAFMQSTTPELLNTFIKSISAFVRQNGFDGVDLDWERNVVTSQYINLIAGLKSAMPEKYLTMASGDWENLPQVAAASHSRLDRIHVMCYSMDYTRQIWHHSALTNGGDSRKPACDGRIGSHTGRGVPASKISVGIPFYGKAWKGGTQPLDSGTNSGVEYSYKDIVRNSTWWQESNFKFDSTYKADYLAVQSTGEFVTYTGTRAIREIVSWAKARGFGGFTTFALEKEYVPNLSGDARHPLSSALFQEIFPSGTDPPKTPEPSGPVQSEPAPAKPIETLMEEYRQQHGHPEKLNVDQWNYIYKEVSGIDGPAWETLGTGQPREYTMSLDEYWSYRDGGIGPPPPSSGSVLEHMEFYRLQNGHPDQLTVDQWNYIYKEVSGIDGPAWELLQTGFPREYTMTLTEYWVFRDMQGMARTAAHRRFSENA